jgi:hypothetical protein
MPATVLAASSMAVSTVLTVCLAAVLALAALAFAGVVFAATIMISFGIKHLQLFDVRHIGYFMLQCNKILHRIIDSGGFLTMIIQNFDAYGAEASQTVPSLVTIC